MADSLKVAFKRYKETLKLMPAKCDKGNLSYYFFLVGFSHGMDYTMNTFGKCVEKNVLKELKK